MCWSESVARRPCRGAPAGSENPSGFHPVAKPIPGSSRGISGWQAEYRHAAAVLPLRARNAAAWRYCACRGRCRIEAG
ncbi:MAG: hypothetical protein LBK61_09775 [Spirochaetaceae bacterium]|nr:hypothetical protein [Spirochaetaceae bacterium]